MKVVLGTQHRENYGAHDWDGEGECPQYWKCKGGDTYVVHDVSIAQAMDERFWTFLREAIESDSDYFQEFVIGSDLVDDIDYDPSEWIEEWDSVIDLRLVDGVVHATREKSFDWRSDEFVGQVQTWKQVEGRQEDMLLEYVRADGSRISYKDWRAQQEAAA